MMPGQTFIAVDIGNSSTKLGWFDLAAAATGLPAPTFVADFRTGEAIPDAVTTRLGAKPVLWRLASVHREGQRLLEEWVRKNRPADDFKILSYRDLPLTVALESPERVGMDRLAAAVAANALREPQRPAIVVDAGSAVTVDLVSGDGAFQGGVILAGFRMQADSLFGGADLLPLALLEPTDEPPAVVGKNTEGAIRSGLFWGAVGAVREVVERMTAELGREPHVYVTGGDLRRLAPLVGRQAEFIPNMVLAGIRIAAD